MVTVRILLRAYYERLHEAMADRREVLVARSEVLLSAEIDARGFGPMESEKVQAYRDACVAFIDERLETYNPIGIQYTFDRSTSRRAAELEFQLDWYDSRGEFEDLVASARALAGRDIPDVQLGDLAGELIRQAGAFPDRTIIANYEEKPTLQKLPDFIVASAIEQIICRPDAG